MRRRRLGPTLAAVALFLLAACLALGAGGASAADPVPNSGITQLSSDHFTIHYARNADTSCTARAISQEKAGDVLRMAERAYAFYSSWGYTPWSATSMHISVDEFGTAPPTCITYGDVTGVPLNPADGTLSSWDAVISSPGGTDELHLDGTIGRGLNYRTIARQVFYLFGRTMDANPWNSSADQWLAGASGEWAALRTDGFAGVTSADLSGSPGRSLDCVGTECGVLDADRNGYSGWLLIEYLAERFGNDAVREVWTQAPAAALTQLSNVLVSHGTTLSTFFNDYAAARSAGKFNPTTVAGALPPTYDPPIAVPQVSGSIPGASVPVNHLAAAFVKLTHGGDPAAPCYEATLSMTVSLPSGVTAVPYFYANTIGATPQAFSVSGSTASVAVPWNTCAGSPAAYVTLPNTSWQPALDGREVVLNGYVSVDKTKPATPSSPPAQVPVGTPVVVVPNTDPPPTFTLHAPEVLRVAAKTRLLRFIVFSSGDGSVQAVLGSSVLGSRTVHAGNNDVRFVLPQVLFKKLRTKSSDNILTITSISSAGTKGMTLTRRVIVQSPPKPKRRR